MTIPITIPLDALLTENLRPCPIDRMNPLTLRIVAPNPLEPLGPFDLESPVVIVRASLV